MFCTQCGNQIIDLAKFCPACGAKVHDEVSTAMPQPPASTMLISDERIPTQTARHPETVAPSAARIFGLFACCLIALGAITYVFTGQIPGLGNKSREHERNSDAIADIGLQLLKRKDALALCEEVSDVEVTSVTSGSASPYNGPNRVPAYIVDYRLGCYSAYNGKSTQLWRIGFAKDAHTGDFYCMKWGDAEFRDEVQEALKASCSFTSP